MLESPRGWPTIVSSRRTENTEATDAEGVSAQAVPARVGTQPALGNHTSSSPARPVCISPPRVAQSFLPGASVGTIPGFCVAILPTFSILGFGPPVAACSGPRAVPIRAWACCGRSWRTIFLGELATRPLAQMIYTALDTFYVTDEQLALSPSRKDGIDDTTESSLRRFGCDLVQESGILLKLPQAVMATGQVLFHRFYCKKSFARFNVKRVAASCVWLAAKLEESPRKIHEVLQVFNRMEQRRGDAPLEFLELSSQKYEEMKTDLIRTERHLLKEMGFICHVEHPHKFIISYLKVLGAPSELMQVAWNLANDSLRSTLCVRFRSEVVACGVVYAAARKFKVPLPDRWWEVFDGKWNEVEVVCKVLAELYKQPKGHYVEVGRDSKSFVLTSKAWDVPTEGQERLMKTMVNGAASVEQVPSTTNSDAGIQKDPALKAPVDKLKPTAVKDRSHDLEEVRNSNANGELRDDPGVGKEKEDETGDKIREKERDRQRLRESRDSGRGYDAERERARGRDRDRERRDREREREERENTREREYRRKERSRDVGESGVARPVSEDTNLSLRSNVGQYEKIRLSGFSRERELQFVRGKDRHYHHRRQNV